MGSCWVAVPLFFLILSSALKVENKFLNKKRNKSSEKEVNRKLDRATHTVWLGYKGVLGLDSAGCVVVSR